MSTAPLASNTPSSAWRGELKARVAERWRDAPAYSDLLRATAHAAEQAAVAAEAAAQAARLSFEAVQATEGSVSCDSSSTATGRPHPQAAGFKSVWDDPWWAERAAPPQPLGDSLEEAYGLPAPALPAKLIEFPRELIATRKQRPRLAEGPFAPEDVAAPLMDDADGEAALEGFSRAYAEKTGAHANPFSSRPAGWEELAWGAIHLGEHPAAASAAQLPVREANAPALAHLAPMRDRLIAAAVDVFFVGAAFTLSVLVFLHCAGHAPGGKNGVVLAAFALVTLAALYGWLFMSFGSGSTPGMRSAHIALCTFGDENPSRRRMQARVPATALALLPLGLGIMWALLDEDRLGWHDRMTRTYQRSYR